MKQIIFVFIAIMAFSCKKEEPEPVKSAQLEVYFQATGNIPNTKYWFNYNNELVENTSINPSGKYQIIIQAVELKNIQGSISFGTGKSLKVVYNHDTIFNKTSTSNSIGFNLNLPDL